MFTAFIVLFHADLLKSKTIGRNGFRVALHIVLLTSKVGTSVVQATVPLEKTSSLEGGFYSVLYMLRLTPPQTLFSTGPTLKLPGIF